jgi:methionyl aminopeptidase
MINLRNDKEIEILRRCNQIVAEVQGRLRQMVEPGITTLELDQEATSLFEKRGVKAAFKGYRGFPGNICTSINDEVVHGIPGRRKLKAGDVISIDMGAILDGYYGDAAITVPVGKITETAEKLLRVTEESLYCGIEAAQPGNNLNDIGASVQQHVESAGFSVVREFVGHGVGTALHEEPQVPNYGARGTGIRLKPGMVLAIEPMVNEGKPAIRILEDGWTAVTVDGKLSAHFEHSIAITEKGPVILSQMN